MSDKFPTDDYLKGYYSYAFKDFTSAEEKWVDSIAPHVLYTIKRKTNVDFAWEVRRAKGKANEYYAKVLFPSVSPCWVEITICSRFGKWKCTDVTGRIDCNTGLTTADVQFDVSADMLTIGRKSANEKYDTCVCDKTARGPTDVTIVLTNEAPFLTMSLPTEYVKCQNRHDLSVFDNHP